MRTATSFMIGCVVGAATVILAKRLRVAVEEDDIESLTDRLAKQLQALEERTTAMLNETSERQAAPSPAT